MEGRERPFDVVDRKRLGIKIVANPIPQLLMLIVVGVTDSIQEIVKSPDAPTIFRWAGELAASAHRIRRVRISSHALLKDNAVLPGIAKIIRVYGLCAGLRQNLVEDVDVMHFTGGNTDERGDVAVQVQQRMHLHGSFVLPEFGPGK